MDLEMREDRIGWSEMGSRWLLSREVEGRGVCGWWLVGWSKGGMNEWMDGLLKDSFRGGFESDEMITA